MTDLGVKPGKGFNLAPGFSFKASLNGKINFLSGGCLHNHNKEQGFKGL
jgi:hypothetical protein